MPESEAAGSAELRNAIVSAFGDVFRKQHNGATPPVLEDATVLMQTGLDSLGFAILVTILEDRLGFDPFSLSAESYYPSTLGDFVAFYARNRPS